ncbi:hypothetical protein SDC9_128973 [bioreactor metagenome]|uniref:Uncharacterized protein n=1 Tax=bioreactor metagenome TaxID=1076179 RepID=A0A645CXQ3_9ZZZZ
MIKIKENDENLDLFKMEQEGSKFKNLILDYRTDIFQRYFGAKGGKTLLFGVIVVCLGRGLIGSFMFQQPFLYSFFYPLIIIGIISTIYLTLKLISFKRTKAAHILSGILLIVCCAFLAVVFLLLFILILNKFFHFWF